MPDEIRDTATTLTDNGLITTRAHIASTIHKYVIDLVVEYENKDDISFIKDYYTNHMLWLKQKQ